MKIVQTLKQPKILNRFKTFGWNVLWTVATLTVAFLTDLVPELNLNQSIALLVSFGLAQVSKYLNSQK